MEGLCRFAPFLLLHVRIVPLGPPSPYPSEVPMAHAPLATPADLARCVTSEWLAQSTEEQILDALASATDEALGYLRGKYRLPLTAWSKDIRDRVCHIAIWKLVNRVGFDESESQFRQNYTDAIAFFRDAATANLNPDIVDSKPANAVYSRVRSEPRRGW